MQKLFVAPLAVVLAVAVAVPFVSAQDQDREAVIRLGEGHPRTGDVAVQRQHQQTNVRMGEMLLQAQEESASKTIEFLAVRENLVQKFKVTYGECKNATTMVNPGTGEKETFEEAKDFSGKSYIVERVEDGETKVTNADGSEADEYEAALVREDTDGFLSSDHPFAELQGRDLRIGQIFDLPAALRRRFEEGGADIKKGVMKFTSIRVIDGERCAVFSLEIQFEQELPVGTMKSTQSGEAVLAIADSRPVKMSLGGPFELPEQGITGDLKVTATTQFRAAPR